MGNERKKINLTDIDEDSIVASFKESRQTDGQVQAVGNSCLEILGASLVLKRPLPYQNWGMLQGLTCSSRIVAELAMKK